MELMTDMMVDVETMSTSPRGGLIQLAAIKFNYMTGKIGDHFDRCPMPLPMRGWSESTREFWLGKNRRVYDSIVARAEPGEKVYRDFYAWAREGEPEGGFRFWAKPLSFDWPFVADHMEQIGMPMPFHFRFARDMNSFMAGMSGNPEHPAFASEGIEQGGDLHNALHDCAFQIDVLLNAKTKFIATEIM